MVGSAFGMVAPLGTYTFGIVGRSGGSNADPLGTSSMGAELERSVGLPFNTGGIDIRYIILPVVLHNLSRTNILEHVVTIHRNERSGLNQFGIRDVVENPIS